MATADDYRRDMRTIRLETAEALRSIPSLAQSWTTRPGSGEGEESWSPREVALHMVYGEWYMLDGTVQMLAGQESLPAADLDRLTAVAALVWARLRRNQQGELDLPNPEAAATALLAIGEKLDPMLALFTDDHLALTVNHPTNPTTLDRRLQYLLDHAVDHLHQLRELA